MSIAGGSNIVQVEIIFNKLGLVETLDGATITYSLTNLMTITKFK